MPQDTIAMPFRAKTQAAFEPEPEYAASYAADVLLLCAFLITLGVPAFYRIGFRLSGFMAAFYLVSAVLAPVVMSLLVWRLRWRSMDAPLGRHIARQVLAFALPALVAVAALVALGQQLCLVGVSVMAFVAGVAVAVNSAIFRYNGGSPLMVLLRAVCMLVPPLVVLGLTNLLPGGLMLVEGWSAPMAVAAAAAFGARRALRSQLEQQ